MADIEELDSFEVSQAIYDAIEKTLVSETSMKTEMLQTWTETINRDSIKVLVKLEKPFKFIVFCNIDQKLGTALYSHSASFLDKEADTVKTFRWENAAMHCVVSVLAFGLV